MVDAQLWSSAFLAQSVRSFIPFGWIWASTFDDLVTVVVNFVGTESLKRVAYYKLTTDFVNRNLGNIITANPFTRCVSLTGASFGGGFTFVPPLTFDQLNSTRVLRMSFLVDTCARRRRSHTALSRNWLQGAGQQFVGTSQHVAVRV